MATSSCEAELYAMSGTAIESRFVKALTQFVLEVPSRSGIEGAAADTFLIGADRFLRAALGATSRGVPTGTAALGASWMAGTAAGGGSRLRPRSPLKATLLREALGLSRQACKAGTGVSQILESVATAESNMRERRPQARRPMHGPPSRRGRASLLLWLL